MFTAEDIGTTVPGDTTYDPADHPETFGTYTVTTHGGDIDGAADSFRFLYFEASGDFSISVCLLEISGLGESSGPKAGVMVRQNTTAGSPHFSQSIERGAGGFCRWRPTQDAGTSPWAGAHEPACPDLSCPTDPYWSRIRREGDIFYGEYSLDGENWTHQAAAVATVAMGDPVLVGIFLCSRFADTTTTAVFTDFRVDGVGPGTQAIAKVEPGDWVYGNEEVTLNGSLSSLATSYQWTYLKEPGGPDITIANPTNVIATFTPPGAEVGYTLAFRLEVEGDTGTDSVDFPVYVRAINPPKVAPGPFRLMPLDLGAAGLGFRVQWDPLIDAEQYDIGLEFGGTIIWLETIGATTYEVKGLTEGQLRTIAIRGRNKYGASNAPASIAKVSYVGRRNLARPLSLGGKSEPSGYVYVISHYAIIGMNDITYNDNNDSWNGAYKEEDYWGYVWASPLFFDHIAYYTGDMLGDGGWFLDLKLQYTQDGTTWLDAPIVKIEPAYDFTDERAGKQRFTRYDITMPTLRGTGIRIAGTPGGTATFTSISEMEVFGLQTQGPLVVQGLDAEYPEGATALLNGSLTFSTAGPVTSYTWTGPGGITITNPTSAIASFQAPHVAADTEYVFSLQASDGTNTGTDADVRIIVKNVVTTAVAGPDQSVEENTQATLSGCGSLTTTGNITYLWTQTGGTNVGVSGSTNCMVTFTAPIIWGYEEPLTFRLNVNDGAGGTSSDEVVITVRNALAWPAYPVTYPATTSYLQNMLHLGTNTTDRLMTPDNWGNLLSGSDPLEPFGGV
ncbi:MAG: hypothetical protein Q8Q12_19875, partial [bacterium]|nr:hypothetical protein [bacterium]